MCASGAVIRGSPILGHEGRIGTLSRALSRKLGMLDEKPAARRSSSRHAIFGAGNGRQFGRHDQACDSIVDVRPRELVRENADCCIRPRKASCGTAP